MRLQRASIAALSIINERSRGADRRPSLNQYDGLSRGDDRSLIFSLADRPREDEFLRPRPATHAEGATN